MEEKNNEMVRQVAIHLAQPQLFKI